MADFNLFYLSVKKALLLFKVYLRQRFFGF